MTRKLDEKCRLVIAPHFRKGDVVKVEQEDADTLIVRRLKTSEHTPSRKRLVRRKDGTTYFTGGKPVNSAIVRKIMEDFP